MVVDVGIGVKIPTTSVGDLLDMVHVLLLMDFQQVLHGHGSGLELNQSVRQPPVLQHLHRRLKPLPPFDMVESVVVFEVQRVVYVGGAHDLTLEVAR
jgi:hypothetical protein